jgi:hypothetical protein
MSSASCITILAVVTVNERAVVEAAADHIANALSQAAGERWTSRCEFGSDLGLIAAAAAGSVVVTSLGPSLSRLDTPWADVEQHLRASYAALCETGSPVMICTILRHVEAAGDPETGNRLRVRLRRLNLLATELSREYGALVIDLDRTLADIGARRLETDYRLGGAAAVDVAGKAVALSVVANALDAFAPVDIQDAARAVLEKYRPAVGLAPEIKMTNLMVLGPGRRKQHVSTVTDAVQENHAGWLVRQVLKRQIGPGEAFNRLVQAVRRRGARDSAALLISGIARLIRPQI